MYILYYKKIIIHIIFFNLKNIYFNVLFLFNVKYKLSELNLEYAYRIRYLLISYN